MQNLKISLAACVYVRMSGFVITALCIGNWLLQRVNIVNKWFNHIPFIELKTFVVFFCT